MWKIIKVESLGWNSQVWQQLVSVPPECLQRIQANTAMPPPNLGSIAGARPRFALRGQSTVKWHWQHAD